MGYSIGWDSTHERDIGYGVPAVCEHPGCNEEINRGMGYACGGGFPEDGCGMYFCGKHLFPRKCERCTEDKEPFDPKPDTKEWIEWKLTDESWQRWRDENPQEVARLTELMANMQVEGAEPLAAKAPSGMGG